MVYRTAVGNIIVTILDSLDLKYPEVKDDMKADLPTAKQILESEND